MAHLSWYRKYRPQSFDDVVGQLHIERTLRNAVGEGSVAHAYLFTGPRGTGKTTTARILAKALNCEHGPTPNPDGTCEQCREIAEGMHPDVYELDAASRTGVDDVREQIIGRVNYAPTRGGWKVYIIDEVHMLSTSAFNALLKTLEEPPTHTVFILCTTHPNKVPETIHSRCQRFDFHRLSVEEIASHLRTITDAEGVTVADGALALIAKHALGGMRDAITTLEQLASFGSGTIQLSDVEGLLGELDADLLFQAADLVCDRDVAGAFRFVARLAEAGIDMSEFVRGLVRHFRDLFVIAEVGADGAVDTTTHDLARLDVQAARFGRDRLARVLGILGELSTDMRSATDQRLAVEVALTRMARPESDLTLEALAERLAALEAGAPAVDVSVASQYGALSQPVAFPTASAAASAVAHSPAPAAAPAEHAKAAASSLAAAAPAAASAFAPEATPAAATPAAPADAPAPVAAPRHRGAHSGPLDIAAVKRAWPAILSDFKKRKPSRAYAFGGTEAEFADGTLIIEFPASQEFAISLVNDTEIITLLRQSVAAVLGQELPVEYRLGRSGRSPGGAARAAAAAPAATSAATSAAASSAPAATVPPAPAAATPDVPATPDSAANHGPAAAPASAPSGPASAQAPAPAPAAPSAPAPAPAPASPSASAAPVDLAASIIAELGATLVDESPLPGDSNDE